MINPRPYQLEGVRRALEHDGFALYMEQRTGKTWVACKVVEARDPDRLLIACPKIAIDVWTAHLEQHPVQAETKILSLESIWRARKQLKRWALKGQRFMAIVDEAHRIKDRGSKVSRALRKLAKFAQFRLALTGTPLEGKIWDAWAQFDFIDPSIFGKWADFESEYLIYGGFRGFAIVGTKNEDDFQKKFHSRFYRVLLEDVKPVKTDIAPDNLVKFDLIESRTMYNSMYLKFLVELADKWVRVKELQADGTYTYVRRRKRIAAPRAITQAMKLHQISGGFILDEEHHVHRFGDEKLAYAGALLLHLGPVPTVVFVRFLPELYRMAALARLLGRDVTLVSGQHKYVSGTPFDLIIVQVRSGISIDLSFAEEAIFYSWGYSGLDYDQNLFRIRSFTSARARYHYLIANNTIDEDLYRSVTEKISFAKLIIDKYKETPVVVRKKILRQPPTSGKIDLSHELKRVRESIAKLLDEELMETPPDVIPPESEKPSAAEPSSTTKPKEKTVPKKSAPKKKVKSTVKKSAAPSANAVKLVDVCKGLKMKPQAARRILRGKKVKNPGRWTWEKGSAELRKVTDILKASQEAE